MYVVNFKQVNLIYQNTFFFENGGLDIPSFKKLGMSG